MNKEKPKAYVVKTSDRGVSFPIDADEVAKVLYGIANHQPVKVRSGIVNPSFYIGIVEDNERISNYMRELNDVIEGNRQYENIGIGQKKPLPEFTQLKDIFAGIDLKYLPDAKKQIGN